MLPLAVFGFHQAERRADSERASADRQTQAAARAAADDLALGVSAALRAANALSAHIGRGGDLGQRALANALSAHLDHHPEFFGGYVASIDGISLLHRQNGEVFGGGTDYSDRTYFGELMRTGQAVVSGVSRGKVTGVLAVQVVSPIIVDTGEIVGFTCSSLDLTALTDRASQAARGMEYGRVLVLDRNGEKVADSEQLGQPAEPLAALPLFSLPATDSPELRFGQDERGRLVRGYAVRLAPPLAGWRALALADQALIDRDARALQWKTLLAAAALGVLSVVTAAGLAAWLSRPVRALAKAAHAVAQGDLSAEPEALSVAPHELALLTDAVSMMLERLRSHTAHLEREVLERTAELTRTNEQLERALQALSAHEHSRDNDLERARRFQAKLLAEMPRNPDFRSAVQYLALDEVSGDFYDLTLLEPGHLRIFLADATGHGVQASLRTLVLKAIYDRLRHECRDPAQLLSQVNLELVRAFPEGDMHCAACCLDLHACPGGMVVSYSNAGTPPVYLLSRDGPALEVDERGPLLGMDELTWPAPGQFLVLAHQVLLIVTDGLTDQQDIARDRFERRLCSASLRGTATPELALSQTLEAFVDFIGDAPRTDDITAIAVQPSPLTTPGNLLH